MLTKPLRYENSEPNNGYAVFILINLSSLQFDELSTNDARFLNKGVIENLLVGWLLSCMVPLRNY